MDFLTEWFWFFLFLPLAALSGWVIGRRGGQRHGDTQVSRLSSTYFRGLNYLLNEQPDKAIELFLHIAELDKETFETQVALGHLFRRRGEVDRAIRLHQGLVQRNDLTDAQRVQALLALGEDYMKSGLLDRAETVFTELAQIDQRAPQALKHLIGIYQAERDWEKAIDNATRYEQVTGEPMGKLIAQYECELADRHRGAGKLDLALQAVARAYQADANSVRAGILEGRIEADQGNDEAAVRAWERAARHDLVGRLEDQPHRPREPALRRQVRQHEARAQHDRGVHVVPTGVRHAGNRRAVLHVLGVRHRERVEIDRGAVIVGSAVVQPVELPLTQGPRSPGRQHDEESEENPAS